MARSRRPAIAAIRRFYQWLSRGGIVKINPAADLNYPSMGRKLPEAMPLEAVEAMLLQTDLETFIGVRDAAIISLLAGCGLRLSGLVAINEGHFFTEADKDSRESAFLRVTEKGGHDRILPVPPETWLMGGLSHLGHEDLKAIDRALPNGDRVLFCNTRHPAKKAFDRGYRQRRDRRPGSDRGYGTGGSGYRQEPLGEKAGRSTGGVLVQSIRQCQRGQWRPAVWAVQFHRHISFRRHRRADRSR